MNRINSIRQQYAEKLEVLAREHEVEFASIQNLLEAEKTRKLLKRNAYVQQTIDKEIDNALQHENK